MSARWYALRAAPRQESAAAERLTSLGLEVLSPVEVRWRRTKFAKTKAETPLFLGYLFVRCEVDEMPAVRQVDGVHHFVGWLDEEGVRRVTPIRDEVVEAIAAEQAAGLHDHTRSARRDYRPGQGERVQIARGLWSGVMARVLANPGGAKAKLMLEGRFGGNVTVDVGALQPA